MRTRVKGRFEPLSDFEIEAYLCGDLGPGERERVEAAVAASAELKEYILRRQAEREAFFRDHPRLELEKEPESVAPVRYWAWAGAAAAAAVAVVALFVVLYAGGEKSSTGDPGIRAMGALKATLAVQRDGRTFRYRPGVLLREGDRVRISVESPQSGHLTVLARGHGGKFEVYYDALRTTAGDYTVPDSLILDHQVGTEDWFIILAPQGRDPREYIQMLQDKRELDARATVIRVVKEAKP
jgi:hypothetical protein